MIKLPQDADPLLQQAISELSDKAGTPVVKHYTAAPLLNQIAQGSHATAAIGGTFYVYHNIGGVLYKVALVAA